MNRYISAVLVAMSSASHGGEFALKPDDLYSVTCINGVDFAEMRAVCAATYPQLKERLEKNHQAWQARNAKALQDIHHACEKRFKVLERIEPERLLALKRFAANIKKTPLLEREGANKDFFSENCNGLADEFAKPDTTAALERLAREISTAGLGEKQ